MSADVPDAPETGRGCKKPSSSTRLRPQVLLIEGCNFEDYPMGGTLTAAKQMLQCFGSRLALVGVSTDDTPIGRWTRKSIDGQEYDFFSIGRVNPAVRRPLIPRRLYVYLRLLRFRRAICEFGARAAYLLSAEDLLAARKWPLSKAFQFCGVENPLKMPRYWWGHLVSGVFERETFRAVANDCELVMAAADERAIAEMRTRSNGILESVDIIQTPTLVDTNVFYPPPSSRSRALTEIVTCGRLNRVKGWDLILDAFGRVCETRTDLRLTFIGDGEDRAKLAAAIEASRLQQLVSVTGLLRPADVAERLRSASLFVMASHHEGWPTALVEALACGLPAICTDVSGASTLIAEGQNGFIAKSRDAEVFASHLRAGLTLDVPNETSLRIAGNYALSAWSGRLAALWEPLR